MYVIENEAHDKISEHKNLSKVQRPDGGWSTNVKVGDPIHDEGGEVYFIHQVLEPIVGEGPRNKGWGPLEYVDGSWQRENRIGPALPPSPDPEPGDKMYNYEALRKRDYEKNIPMGDQADAILKWAVAIRMKQSSVDDAIDGITAITEQSEKDALKTAFGPIFDLPADLDGIVGKWTAVKTKYPKPEE